MGKLNRAGLALIVACTAGFPVVPIGSAQDLTTLEQEFAHRRGQLQVGGPFAGLEFHHARPVPSRISFYYPVANSIDLSTDYWKRYESLPFRVTITVDGQSVELEDQRVPYRSTPASVVFDIEGPDLKGAVTYRFAESAPFFVFTLRLVNVSGQTHHVDVETSLDLVLHTSHTYAARVPSRTGFERERGLFLSEYDEADTGPAVVFIASADSGTRPSPSENTRSDEAAHKAALRYGAPIAPGDTVEIVQLIGSTRRSELESVLSSARGNWLDDVTRYEKSVLQAGWEAPFRLPDSNLAQTAQWSKALLQSNRHYIDGHVAPMPCPAQYNFFFTHDLLLTDLGAVNFDAERVKADLLYLHSLAAPDSLLPHAYYWKDGNFKTEFAGSDNWNHLWFVILSSSYLKHTGDEETVGTLWPMLTRSIGLMLENERDGLMYAERPDWWDIGHVYGARAYTTILAIRALRSFAYMEARLGRPHRQAGALIRLSEVMQRRLSEELWDDEAGYLLNRIEGNEVDRHYYSGSLLAAGFGYLASEQADRLLDTARDELLDAKIGIRNAMPTDFEDLVEKYRFQVGEVGAPYQYMNGGVWPQGTAWFIMALANSGRADEALAALSRYLSLDGIRNSPNGQPAFYEYRNADPASPLYGSIDKTTFLWAGGFYLNVLYQVLGVRENEWNIAFDPHLPTGFNDIGFELMIDGQSVDVEISGQGSHFRQIEKDGKATFSAVMTSAAKTIRLVRGDPVRPYLASANAIVGSVTYAEDPGELKVTLIGEPDQTLRLNIVSPDSPTRIVVDGSELHDQGYSTEREDGATVTAISTRAVHPNTVVSIRF